MSYGIETLTTSQNTRIDIEVHKNPADTIKGAAAHWGEPIEDIDLKDRIWHAYPAAKLDENTGFDRIWHQKDGVSRDLGIKDELEVAEIVARKTLEVNGWGSKDVAGLLIGSGVPVADDPRYPNYAEELSKRLNLNDEVYLHSSYIACASGGSELIKALGTPHLSGKPILVMGMEGITYLTEDFNPEYADALSMRFFSNGAAGIGLIPDVNMTLLSSAREVVEDTRGVLKAKMTYEKIFNPEGEVMQESKNLRLIKLPNPDNNMRISMQGPRTAQFFYSNGVELLKKLDSKHKDAFPEVKPDYGVSHHPSLTTHEHLVKKLTDAGMNIEIPWVVNDGNSSAATTLIAELRQLDMAREGTVQLLSTYGAGGDFEGAVILNGPKRS